LDRQYPGLLADFGPLRDDVDGAFVQLLAAQRRELDG
jgi:hypothetical protein